MSKEKKKKIKKMNFLDGTLLGTISLVICKIMGLIYVIPFFAIIGSKGGALYSYAYSMYAVFLNLSTVGIPSAVAKIISEYDTLEYYHAKDKAYNIASRILTYVGIISFIVMFAFANQIAKMIIGDVTGGNSVESVATAIRVVSTALLIVPKLSILKGYFQGHKYLKETSLSSIIEQFVRVAIIIIGSYTTVKLFNLPIDFAVYLATFGATAGALIAFIYLKVKNKELDGDNADGEKKSGITKKEVIHSLSLYNYTYSVYSIFLKLSSAKKSSAIIKNKEEQYRLGQYHTNDKVYNITSKILTYVGIIGFIVLFVYADQIAKKIIGNVSGGNSIYAVATAIRVVFTVLLFIPKLDILKRYFQRDNKYLKWASIYTIIEQFVRISLIIIISYIAVKRFDLRIDIASYLSMLGVTICTLLLFLYLKVKNNVIEKKYEGEEKEEEKKLTTKAITKKIVVYAFPFVIMSLLQSAYRIVDTFTVVRVLSRLGYSVDVAEDVFSVISTQASKLSMIVVSISVGLAGSLIPNVVSSFTKGDYKDVNEKFNLSFKMLLLLTIPMSIGMCILAEPVWHLFYGVDALKSSIFRISILEVIIYGLFTTSTTITQSMNQTKITISALISSFILKAALNVPMMYFLKYIGFESYYATTITDAIAQLTSLIFVMIILKKKFNFNYKSLWPFLLKVLVGASIMTTALLLFKNFVFFTNASVIKALLTVIVYTLIGAFIYLFIAVIFKLPEEILGENYLDKLLKKLKIRRSN